MPLTVAEFVSETGPDSNSFVSRTLNFVTPVPIGTRAVVLVDLYTTTGVAATAGMISDDGGHTWVQDVGQTGDGSTGGVAILSTVATAEINSVTLTPGGSGNYATWGIARLSGPADLDDAEVGSGSSTSPQPTTAMEATTTDGVALSVISTRSQTGDQTQPATWTLELAQRDNSTDLAGALAYTGNISSSGTVASTWTTTTSEQWFFAGAVYKAVESGATLTLPHIASAATLHTPTVVGDAFGPVTRFMGGTQETGWFGNESLGGAQTTALVKTFDPPIPAGYGVVVFQTLYNYTPSDASLWALAGSGNTLTRTPGAQTAHNASGSNDNSVTFYHSVLASECASATFDPTSLPAGDSGRYGQIVFWVVKEPDTVNGFFTATPATNTQTSTTTVNPGTLTLPTTDCLELFGAATRGHSNDLLPVVESPDEWPDALKHTYFDDASGSYPGAFQNSIIASGAAAGRRNTSGTTSTPVWTFTGTGPATGSAHSVLVAYNILGGTIPSQDVTLPTITSAAALHAPTVTVGAVSLTLPTIASTTSLHVPIVGGAAITLTLPTISSTTQLFEPLVSADALAIGLPHIASALSLTPPALSVGAVSLVLSFITNSSTVFAPSVVLGAPGVGPDSDQWERYIRPEFPRLNLSANVIPASPRPSQE